ncbi:MAG TPA: dihydroorotate dehydrogenase-like protein [Ignavibacteria bacterium]|nr:dihydroorotate dehydrogenase-like protein [Ignavibacteria bacterium]
MVDTTTNYMGLKLKNPLVPSASPLSKDIGMIKEMEDAGAAAVVLYSLFEEQIIQEQNAHDYFMTYGSESYAEALTYFPETEEYARGPEDYLEHIRKAKEVVNIPIIASLNGVSKSGWLKYAKLIEQAGADALELNVYYVAADFSTDSEIVENIYIRDLKAVKEHVKIPVAMKLSPYFSSMANMAKKLDEAGADALVLFNRFYQPDFDLDNLEIVPNLTLSHSWELRLPLRWLAILYGRIEAGLAATSGIQNYTDLIKVLMAGGDVAMICSELLRNGIKRIPEILSDLTNWMEVNEYGSVSLMKGSMSQRSVADPAAFERANYMKILNTYKI